MYTCIGEKRLACALSAFAGDSRSRVYTYTLYIYSFVVFFLFISFPPLRAGLTRKRFNGKWLGCRSSAKDCATWSLPAEIRASAD